MSTAASSALTPNNTTTPGSNNGEDNNAIDPALQTLFAGLNPPAADILRLNVGGRLIWTTRATLCRERDSLLAKFFGAGDEKHWHSQSLNTDSTGAIFVNRSGDAFAVVHEWLRSGFLPPEMDRNLRAACVAEARFWQLNSLLAVLGIDVVALSHMNDGAPVPPSLAASAASLEPPLSQAAIHTCMQISNTTAGGQLSLPRANLSGAYLAGTRLEKAYFAGSFMRHASLRAANLSNADLSDADLTGADVCHANFNEALLRGARLPLDLSHANFVAADLSDVDLSACTLTYAHLVLARLDGARLPTSAPPFFNEPLVPQIRSWSLLYRASRDSFSTDKFHSICDERAHLFALFEDVDGNVFGGYTAHGWRSRGDLVADPHAFLVTLRNPFNVPPTRFSVEPSKGALFHSTRTGPQFGLDIQVGSTAGFVSFGFPQAYEDTTGKGALLFTGKQRAALRDISVYVGTVIVQ